VGSIHPENVITAAIFVHRIVAGERTPLWPGDASREKAVAVRPRLTREQIAQRAAQELPDGAYVNLGWGIPNLIAEYLPKESPFIFTAKMEFSAWARAPNQARKISIRWTR